MADMYKQGLISQGMLTSNTEELIQITKRGCSSVLGGTLSPRSETAGKTTKTPTGRLIFCLPDQTAFTWRKAATRPLKFAVISKNAKHPEAIIKMLNIYNREPG